MSVLSRNARAAALLLAVWILQVPPSAASAAARGAGGMPIELPPIPSPQLPADRTPPAHGHLERDSARADRFTTQGQLATYAFESRAGELSVFGLEAWGWARGWRSTARVRVLDAAGRVLLDEERTGPSVYHHLTEFRAPATGHFRYELTAAGASFRYRLTRHSSFSPHAAETPRPLDGVDALSDYLASSSDRVRCALELEAGEEVWLKVSNTDPAGRAERRAFNPPRLGEGSYGGYLQQGFVLDVACEGVVWVDSVRSVLFHAPRSGTYEVCVHAQHATATGGGGLFDLELRRGVEKVEIAGVVQDEEGVPLAGVRVIVLHGIDRDLVGATRTASDGRYLLCVPPGACRVHLERAELGSLDVEFALPGKRERNFVLPTPR